LLLSTLVVVVLGCSGSPSEPRQGELAFETLAKTTVLGGSTPPHLREVVRDRGRFNRLWSELFAGAGESAPGIDFRRDMVVAVTAGGWCYDDVRVERITLEQRSLVVDVVEALPNCLCVSAPHSTFHLVRLRRLDAEEQFVERETNSACGG
jgi:hypothetical protein